MPAYLGGFEEVFQCSSNTNGSQIVSFIVN
jgi:hypothetical protein